MLPSQPLPRAAAARPSSHAAAARATAAAPRAAATHHAARCSCSCAPGTSSTRSGARQQPRRARPRCCSFLDDGIEARPPAHPDPTLGGNNPDLLPVPASARDMRAGDFALLWVTLVVSVTSYYLAASLVDAGFAWWQGVVTVLVANLCTLAAMVLNAHAGCKYGLPFPVLARAAFGIRGAHLPSLSRALVACAWFGLNTWVGGSSIAALLAAAGVAPPVGAPLPGLGISAFQLCCFLCFWALQVGVILRGMGAIKRLETASAPVLAALALALLAWALGSAGGLGPMLSAPSQFGPGMPLEGRFWSAVVPAVTANVGYWATLALNIPDFSRYAVSQRAQVIGQALGLPPAMAAFSFIGLAVTSATVVLFGAPIRDPVQLLTHMRQPLAVCVALFGLSLATLTTNIAANVLPAANALMAAAPRLLSFEAAGVLAAALGLLVQPWRLYEAFLGFLAGYTVLLGPISGVLLADYFIVRRRSLQLDDLFSASPTGAYWFVRGFNPAALAAVAAGAAPCLPGAAAALGLAPQPPPLLAAAYDAAWFVGVAVAGAVYCAAMRAAPGPRGGATELGAQAAG